MLNIIKNPRNNYNCGDNIDFLVLFFSQIPRPYTICMKLSTYSTDRNFESVLK